MSNLVNECNRLWNGKRITNSELNKSIFANIFLKISSDLDISLARQILYHATNNIDTIPKCHCGNKLKWHHTNYRDFCSRKCTAIYTCLQAVETSKKNHGGVHHTQTENYRTQVKITSNKKFGVDHYSKTKEKRVRTVETNLLTYGVEYPAQSKDIQEQTKQKNKERTGYAHHTQNPDRNNELIIQNRTHKFAQVLENRPTLTALFDIEKYVSGSGDTEFEWRCDDCDTEFKHIIRNCKCPTCYPLYESSGERIIRIWLEAHDIKYIKSDTNKIKPYHIDFFMPEYNIGIEFNGIYWHSERVRPDPNYHFRKFLLAKEKKIRLIQIWEQDLEFNQSLVFDKLSHLLEFSNNRSNLFNSLIKRIDVDQAMMFLNSYDLDGFQDCENYYGYFSNDELISVLSISKNRVNDISNHIIDNFATSDMASASNQLSKFLSFIQKDLGNISLLSYVNLNWNYSKEYDNNGFSFMGYSKPNYKYFRSLYDIKTKEYFIEEDVAKSSGYVRIYNSGNGLWFKQLI